MAQPDEVWNFDRGDGLEKAICLANVIRARRPDDELSLDRDGSTVCLGIKGGKEFRFLCRKEVRMPEPEEIPRATTPVTQA
jgi:hypothetical protein